MSKKTLRFGDIRVNKQEFHKSRLGLIPINLVKLDQIVISEHNDDDFKYFTSYKEGEIVKSLCIILPQISKYIECFENGGKNMSFVIKGYHVLDKYNRFLNKIKKTFNIKFHSIPVCDEKIHESKRIQWCH